MKRPLTLNSRILILVLGGLALPVILLAVLLFLALTQFETTRRAEDYLGNVALATMREVDSLLNQAAAVARVAAIDQSVVSLLEQEPAIAEKQDELASHLEKLSEYHQIKKGM